MFDNNWLGPTFSKFLMVFGIVIFIGGILLVAATFDSGRPSDPRPLPTCEEDEVYLVGRGEFTNGRWQYYECVHPDDL